MKKKDEVLGVINCWANNPQYCLRGIRNNFRADSEFHNPVELFKTRKAMFEHYSTYLAENKPLYPEHIEIIVKRK